MSKVKHRKEASRGPGFTCVFCDKHFSGTTSQPIHIRRHIQEKPYNCRECDFSATCITDVYLHERKMHAPRPAFKCSMCPRTFKNVSGLKGHFQRMHFKNVQFEKAYKCPTCGKEFGDQSSLTQHARVHSERQRFECRGCGKVFPIEKSLLRHKEEGNCAILPTTPNPDAGRCQSPLQKSGRESSGGDLEDIEIKFKVEDDLEDSVIKVEVGSDFPIEQEQLGGGFRLDEKDPSAEEQKEKKSTYDYESNTKAHLKYMAKVKAEDPEKWARFQERHRQRERARQARETPEQRRRRKHVGKVGRAKKMMRSKLEALGADEDEIERRVEEMRIRMWKEFDPEGEVPTGKPGRPMRKS